MTSVVSGAGAGTGVGTAPVGPSPLQRAVRTYLDHLVVERGLAENTVKSYRRDLRRYVGFLAGRGVDDLGAVDESVVAEFLVHLREGDADHPPLAAGSAGRTVVAVRGFHRFAVRDGLTQGDPAAAVRPPAPAKRLPKALPVAEIERILEAASIPGTALALRDRALLELLYGCGARISEAVGLDVDDLSLETATVRLRGKGSKERLVPFGQMAAAALDAYLVRGRPALATAGSGNPAVFLNARGGRLSRQSAWTVLARAAGVGRGQRRGLAAHAAPLVRDAPARRRGRRPGGAGAARPRLGDHDPGLHAGDGRQPPRGVRHRAPARPGVTSKCRLVDGAPASL